MTRSRILALGYDPTIGEVEYDDLMSAPISHDYGNQLLHVVMAEAGWRDPYRLAQNAESQIEASSGGAVEIDLSYYTLNEWPLHHEGQMTWRISGSLVLSKSDFTAWDEDSFPGYPFIPKERRGGVLHDSGWWPNVPAYDYDALMEMPIEQLEDKTVAQLLSTDFDELWLFGDPTSRYQEGNNIGPDPINLNGDVIQSTAVPHNVPIMGYGFEGSEQLVYHSFAHRAEQVFASVFDGNLKPTCIVNRTETNFYNHFTRLANCFTDTRFPTAVSGTRTPQPTTPPGYVASIGVVHLSHNAPVWFPNDFNSLELHDGKEGYGGESYWGEIDPEVGHLSDGPGWYEFPNIDSRDPEILGTNRWIGGQGGWYGYWIDHLPRYAGVFATATPVTVTPTPQTGTPVATKSPPGAYNNLWPMLMKPGCFDLRAPRDVDIP